MEKITILMKKRLLIFLFLASIGWLILFARVVYIQVVLGEDLQSKAYEQQTRDRLIAPKRGSILDRNGVGLALTETVNTISVIPIQVKQKEQTAKYLSEMLELDYNTVLEKVKQNVALVRIKNKVDKQTALEIRKKAMPGIVVDEDIKRVYPYSCLASQVLGFVGKDNQGIIGLESKYNEYLQGKSGKILTLTDSRGLTVDNAQERIPPEDGKTLVTSIDVVVQQYAEQTLAKAVEAKGAKNGIIIVMNPQNGEIYAMANYPSFDLNDPFTINSEELASIWGNMSEQEKNDALNQMWRNTAINDTYEPGSTFKTITSSAGLEEGVVTPESSFVCNGYYVAGDRQIKCWRYPRTHGAETFVQGVQNSCNPVFMIVAERMGAEVFADYMTKFGFREKTGIDLPGEAVGIIHKTENIGPVELATMSFGQSFQITPLQLLRAVSAIINGGNLVTPHIATEVLDENGNIVQTFEYEKGTQIISQNTSEQMKKILESVVSEGTGNKAYIPGYRIGGKTATSEKLPRRSGKYIASFLTFAPAENPQVLSLVLINEPQGNYYGGSVAGPVMKELLQNILPYLGIETIYSQKELEMEEVQKIIVPDFVGMTVQEAKKALYEQQIEYEIQGEGETITYQFPNSGEEVNKNTKILLSAE
ncbi:penicillin-binding transpeptidase domain-containing protein [Clostridium sp. MD294]|uniref:penicillin-binding transpeptidase domain-containing protein n=1 Tax=Clostridium sp. MD294 TaxID=97138 RepID=UPI0002CBF0FA|nr:penicillin-binding transpeptidase domain-containing protein [Clostridium sp. MD294]NDO46910.1 PASTA domain-containing protein [Clostridium sp. MD294]USF28647.1 Stage V sporulation protein D [Clostridium sp. MD294]